MRTARQTRSWLFARADAARGSRRPKCTTRPSAGRRASSPSRGCHLKGMLKAIDGQPIRRPTSAGVEGNRFRDRPRLPQSPARSWRLPERRTCAERCRQRRMIPNAPADWNRVRGAAPSRPACPRSGLSGANSTFPPASSTGNSRLQER